MNIFYSFFFKFLNWVRGNSISYLSGRITRSRGGRYDGGKSSISLLITNSKGINDSSWTVCSSNSKVEASLFIMGVSNRLCISRVVGS